MSLLYPSHIVSFSFQIGTMLSKTDRLSGLYVGFNLEEHKGFKSFFSFLLKMTKVFSLCCCNETSLLWYTSRCFRIPFGMPQIVNINLKCIEHYMFLEKIYFGPLFNKNGKRKKKLPPFEWPAKQHSRFGPSGSLRDALGMASGSLRDAIGMPSAVCHLECNEIINFKVWLYLQFAIDSNKSHTVIYLKVSLWEFKDIKSAYSLYDERFVVFFT